MGDLNATKDHEQLSDCYEEREKLRSQHDAPLSQELLTQLTSFYKSREFNPVHQHNHRLCGPLSLPHSGYRGTFPGGKVSEA
jgi:hypothetical protein